MLVAYNAGPGNLAKWKQQYADTLNDPLLFIESLPAAETRSYVQHVMANDWIYRQRLQLPAPLLNDAGDGPLDFGCATFESRRASGQKHPGDGTGALSRTKKKARRSAPFSKRLKA